MLSFMDGLSPMQRLSKATLRIKMKERRVVLFQGNLGAAHAIVPLFFSHIQLPPNSIVGSYWPMGTELDIRPLLKALDEKGISCALPCVDGEEMIFRLWDPSMTLVKKKGFGDEPPLSSPAVTPTILLVPFLAFDARGHRLGYGKGHYDRYLHHRKVLSIGVGFQGQEVEEIPHESHDIALDFILTEGGIVSC